MRLALAKRQIRLTESDNSLGLYHLAQSPTTMQWAGQDQVAACGFAVAFLTRNWWRTALRFPDCTLMYNSCRVMASLPKWCSVPWVKMSVRIEVWIKIEVYLTIPTACSIPARPDRSTTAANRTYFLRCNDLDSCYSNLQAISNRG